LFTYNSKEGYLMSSHQFIRCTAPILALTALLLGGLALAPTPVQAATFTVTNGSDSGSSTLREAIADANANPNADTITFGSAAARSPLGRGRNIGCVPPG
jgi:hypothetical protein